MRAQLTAELNTTGPVCVQFQYSIQVPDDTDNWIDLGTDDNAPYQIYIPTDQIPDSSMIKIRLKATTLGGRTAQVTADSVTVYRN